MAVRGINHIKYTPDSTSAPSEQPQASAESLPTPERIEVTPPRSQSQMIGQRIKHLDFASHYQETVGAIIQTNESNNRKIESGLDALDKSTKKLIKKNTELAEANAQLIRSPYRPSPTLFGRHRRS